MKKSKVFFTVVSMYDFTEKKTHLISLVSDTRKSKKEAIGVLINKAKKLHPFAVIMTYNVHEMFIKKNKLKYKDGKQGIVDKRNIKT